MKVCDLHPDRRAEDTILVTRDDSRIDVCAECKTAVLLLLSGTPLLNVESPPKRGRPPKNLANS